MRSRRLVAAIIEENSESVFRAVTMKSMTGTLLGGYGSVKDSSTLCLYVSLWDQLGMGLGQCKML